MKTPWPRTCRISAFLTPSSCASAAAPQPRSDGPWEKVSRECQAKSAYAQADLHQAFLEMRCAKGDEVRDFLASLCCKREELATAGVLITEKESSVQSSKGSRANSRHSHRASGRVTTIRRA